MAFCATFTFLFGFYRGDYQLPFQHLYAVFLSGNLGFIITTEISIAPRVLDNRVRYLGVTFRRWKNGFTLRRARQRRRVTIIDNIFAASKPPPLSAVTVARFLLVARRCAAVKPFW